MKNLTLCSLLLLLCLQVKAYESDTLNTEEISEEAMFAAYEAYLDSIDQTFEYEQGKINLGARIATLKVPEGFKYLNGTDSERVLVDIWGNPPSDEKSLGMLVPADHSVLADSIFVINITYSEDGYIDDSDAKDIDYDELLEEMQADTRDANEYRLQEGYPSVDLIGWASPPFYDAESKKLHWAKELKFGADEINTLNYNIRILGRKGYLQLNAISDVGMLGSVKENINPILASVDFNPGYKYSDFDPDIDQIAAYGIGGLIAGKVLAKAGILAKVGILLAKFWKIIVFGVIGFFAVVRNFFSGKKKDSGQETV